MIVSHTLKVVFVHIPENGGTTVESLSKPHLNVEIDIHVSKGADGASKDAVAEKLDRFRLRIHMPADQISGAVMPQIYGAMFSFVISRKPYSRCFSAYSCITRRAAMDQRRAAKSLPARPRPWRQPDFDRSEFLPATFDEICARLPDAAATHGLFRPQVHWLPEPNSASCVGRLETLAQDLRHIYHQVGMPTQGLTTIPRENVKAGSGSWRGMSVASTAAIRAFYAEDFARFGYDPDFAAPEFLARSAALDAPAPPAPSRPLSARHRKHPHVRTRQRKHQADLSGLHRLSGHVSF